jgi:hypothetical protein
VQICLDHLLKAIKNNLELSVIINSFKNLTDFSVTLETLKQNNRKHTFKKGILGNTAIAHFHQNLLFDKHVVKKIYEFLGSYEKKPQRMVFSDNVEEKKISTEVKASKIITKIPTVDGIIKSFDQETYEQGLQHWYAWVNQAELEQKQEIIAIDKFSLLDTFQKKDIHALIAANKFLNIFKLELNLLLCQEIPTVIRATEVKAKIANFIHEMQDKIQSLTHGSYASDAIIEDIKKILITVQPKFPLPVSLELRMSFPHQLISVR